MKTFFYKLMAIVLPVGIMVCLVNYIVDPANIFTSTKYVSGIADILAKGHNVDNISNYNERLLQEQMVKRLNSSPDIVVLGSSRVMEIGSDFFPGKKVLNAGVSHGNIYDIIAITGLLDSLHLLPKEIYLNTDPYLVSINGSSEWESLSAYYQHFISTNDHDASAEAAMAGSGAERKLYSLVSFEYFKESIEFLIKGVSKKYYDVGKARPQIYGRFSDGTVSYSDSYMHPDTTRVASIARLTGAKDGLPVPDSNKIKLFNNWLDFMQKKNIKVHFIMLPFHRNFFTVVNDNQKKLFNDYELFFRKIAAEKNIEITGSFNATEFGFNGSEFYDMYHCSKTAIQKIVSIR